MTRLARVVAVGMPHHVTQRGNARQYILHSDADRTVYLDLLRQNIEQHKLTLIGYCLMPATSGRGATIPVHWTRRISGRHCATRS
jgi:REP element-mobilizing transposase RayT